MGVSHDGRLGETRHLFSVDKDDVLDVRGAARVFLPQVHDPTSKSDRLPRPKLPPKDAQLNTSVKTEARRS